MIQKIAFAALFALSRVGALAQDDGLSPALANHAEQIRTSCGLDDPSFYEERRRSLADQPVFPQSGRLAAKLIDDYCTGPDRRELFDDIRAVAESLKREAVAHDIEWRTSDDGKYIGVERFIDKVKAGIVDGVEVPNIAYAAQGIDVYWNQINTNLSSAGVFLSPANQDDCDAVTVRVASGQDCNAYLEAFANVFNDIQFVFATKDAVDTYNALVALDDRWATFLERTTDQTPHELWLNGLLFRQEHKGYRAFVEPPIYQHILLKPYIAGDYLGEAPDGSQLNEAVVLDVWGLKRIKEDGEPWYRPIGGSLHVVAADRPGVGDIGVGLSIHFSDMNTIGISSYDGDLGIFLSFDLWKNATKGYDTVTRRIDNYRTKKNELLQFE